MERARKGLGELAPHDIKLTLGGTEKKGEFKGHSGRPEPAPTMLGLPLSLPIQGEVVSIQT